MTSDFVGDTALRLSMRTNADPIPKGGLARACEPSPRSHDPNGKFLTRFALAEIRPEWDPALRRCALWPIGSLSKSLSDVQMRKGSSWMMSQRIGKSSVWLVA